MVQTPEHRGEMAQGMRSHERPPNSPAAKHSLPDHPKYDHRAIANRGPTQTSPLQHEMDYGVLLIFVTGLNGSRSLSYKSIRVPNGGKGQA